MAEYFIGLISGTSMDGIDAVLCDIYNETPNVLAAQTLPFTVEIRRELDRVRHDPDGYPTARLMALDCCLGDAFAEAALAVLQGSGVSTAEVRAIGSHGQTIVHRPDAKPPYTLQIADPHRIAERTGILTIADFRRADLAAGGQGAPLAPLIHRVMLGSPVESRVVVNLGGIANITILPAGEGLSGFDTGPANCFVDLWYRRHHGERFDRAGAWAASGQCDPDWLAMLMSDSYFQRPAPKSTGIEYFSAAWLESRLPAWAEQRPADIQATLLEFSARTVVEAVLNLPATQVPARLIACGGGAHNPLLLDRIAHHLDSVAVHGSSDFGVHPDHIEATLFAWLARERLAERAVATPSITGARHAVLAGSLFAPGPE